jgi:hypothetical protein
MIRSRAYRNVLRAAESTQPEQCSRLCFELFGLFEPFEQFKRPFELPKQFKQLKPL